MRGKVQKGPIVPFRAGITPACAGKSWTEMVDGVQKKDHPRVCGEKGLAPEHLPQRWGSPPRVRGKDRPRSHGAAEEGITPACAGKRRL